MHSHPIVKTILCLVLSLSFSCNSPYFEDKKNNTTLLFLTAFLISANACSAPNDFWARNITTNQSVCVTTELVYSGTNIEVYRETSLTTGYNFNAFGQRFDTVTYPKLVSTFGAPSDVDKDGKVKILALDIKDGATSTSSFVAGFYDPVNYFPDSVIFGLRSNYAEILYMDGKELIAATQSDANAFDSTAAHEFQHLIRFPYSYDSGVSDDVWVNEGTSEVASDIAGYGPQTSRIQCYRGSTCSGGINNVSMLEWNSQADIIKQYSFAYVFMRFLYDSSGTTEAERNSFFRKTVVGNASGVRANNAFSLMRNFILDAPDYSPANFGGGSPTTDEVFFRMYSLLMGYTLGSTPDFVTMTRIPKTGGSAVALDLSTAATAYPLPSTLTTPTNIQIQSAINSSSLKLAGANFFNNTSSSLNTNVGNSGRIVNGANNSVLYWGSFTSSNTSSGFTARTLRFKKPKLEHLQSMITQSQVDHNHTQSGICASGFIDVPNQTSGNTLGE
ncbi:peptidase MA family protein [Leptospira sp. 96542]|nr:peptidase MA family protein [Leptospira sp. 96542]